MTHYDKEREADELWRNAPEDATHYADSVFWRYDVFGEQWIVYREDNKRQSYTENSPYDFERWQERPQHTTKQPETAQDALKPQSPYQRTIIGLNGSKFAVDVYRVLDAFKTDSPALDHAVKKILCPGTRHAKTREQDLKEAIKSIEAELLLMSQR